jgi:serine phosphatase RsbU (regulator of sigma subunit)
MAVLVATKGPLAGRRFPLAVECVVLGRQRDSTIELDAPAVSRHHARIVRRDDAYLIEDLHSSNGTFVNGKAVREPVRLDDGDDVQIGPYSFTFRQTRQPELTDTDLIIRDEVSALPTPETMHGQDAAYKLDAVLEIGQLLACNLEMEPLLRKLLDHLLGLFSQADRGLVLLCDREEVVLRAYCCRGTEAPATFPYSRTVIRRALQEGVGILSEDVRSDVRFRGVSTFTALNLLSLVCVPLIGKEGRRVGVLQLDCSREGQCFKVEDLKLLTAIGLQVAVALENVALHQEVLREERTRHELALAREIQEDFLPVDFPAPAEHGFELFAHVNPARTVSGDLYDFFFLKDGRLIFLVADVSGKGVPAALFMLAVRTLARHLAGAGDSPAQTLRQLNAVLSADNASGIFVTLVLGVYQPDDGGLVLASCAHPAPLLRRADGRVEILSLDSGTLLGLERGDMRLADTKLTLGVGETLAVYTDGLMEAMDPHSRTQFGLQGLQNALASLQHETSLRAFAGDLHASVERFTGKAEIQDDQTLLLLRRLV